MSFRAAASRRLESNVIDYVLHLALLCFRYRRRPQDTKIGLLTPGHFLGIAEHDDRLAIDRPGHVLALRPGLLPEGAELVGIFFKTSHSPPPVTPPRHSSAS